MLRAGLLVLATTLFVAAPGSALTLFEPTPYLSFVDSPFAAGNYAYFHLD